MLRPTRIFQTDSAPIHFNDFCLNSDIQGVLGRVDDKGHFDSDIQA